MRHSAQLLPRNATRARSCLKNGHASSWPSSPHSEAVRETYIIAGQCSTCCCWCGSEYRRRPDARMRHPSRTNKRVNKCPSELNNTERRLLVATPRAIASAQCHKGTFLLEKRTRRLGGLNSSRIFTTSHFQPSAILRFLMSMGLSLIHI